MIIKDSNIIKKNKIEDKINERINNINNNRKIKENKELIISNPLIQSINEDKDKIR